MRRALAEAVLLCTERELKRVHAVANAAGGAP